MFGKLKLCPKERVASGTQREIYCHPTDPTKLVKVLRDIPQSKGRARLAVLTETYLPSYAADGPARSIKNTFASCWDLGAPTCIRQFLICLDLS